MPQDKSWTLSFEYVFEVDNDVVFFSFHYPYTYTYLTEVGMVE